MTDLELYRQLLGLADPWQVETVDVDPNASQVRVRVVAQPTARWQCPVCQQPAAGYDTREERAWRHLDSCGFETWLVAAVPRVNCREHGVRTVNVPWAAPYSRFTLAFACFATVVLRATQVQAQAAALLHLSPAAIEDLMEREVAAGLERRQATTTPASPPLAVLTLDEKHYGRGQCYLAVLGDPAGKRVLDVGPSRTAPAVASLLNEALSPGQRQEVRAVAVDLWEGFHRASRTVLPEADLVYDRFHAAAELSEALDETRRQEHRQLRLTGHKKAGRRHARSPLSGTRHWWLRGAETLTDEQRAFLAAGLAAGWETAKVWECKEAFRAFFAQESPVHGERFLSEWLEKARAVGNRHLARVANLFEQHRDKLLAALRHQLSNAFGEYLNSRIQELKQRARGFRRFVGYRRAILFHLGGLDLCPQLSP
jgi:transposase